MLSLLARSCAASQVRRRIAISFAAVALAVPVSLSPTIAQADSTVSGVVNTYQAVSSITGQALTLSGTAGGAPGPIKAGDRVLIIQMTGQNPSTGSNLGNYETATVASASGSTVTLTAPLRRSYSPGTDRVQLVRMVVDAGRLTLASTVTALPWNGTIGGVVAMSGGTLDLAAKSINVAGDGFSSANAAYERVVPGNTVHDGSATGRGVDGVSIGNGGGGGGGIGGGGGTGGNGSANAGGSVGGGRTPEGSKTANGSDGGNGAAGTLGNTSGGGSGGGGGVIGGGGGGGGGDLAVPGSGGGGGVAGGGGGGHGSVLGVFRAGAGGGGVGSVGNGGDGLSGSYLHYGSAGGGGGSYGGGGASGGIQGATSTGGGGGGGGSWTGGGSGGYGNNLLLGFRGGAGNAAVDGPIPDSAHYLTAANPRLMMGGAGGRGSADTGSINGGEGGGVAFLDFTTITGGTINADGNPGIAPKSGVHSGSGGGAGGQVKITGSASGLTVTADGGDGGKPSSKLLGAGAGGGGGGAGGIWLELPGATKKCAATSTISGVTTSVTGGISPRIANATVGGGTGGTGLVCSSPVVSYAIGDRVWRDRNADGVQTSGEPGLVGVGVSLLDAAGTVAAITTTDSTGRYVFDNLREGTYRVRFGLPAQCAYAARQVAGSTADNDSDPQPMTGTTTAFSIGAGQPQMRPTQAADGGIRAAQINPTVDAGLVCSTTSATSTGAYSKTLLSDLLPDAVGPFDGATGTAVMSVNQTSSSFLLQVSGIAPSGTGTMYGAHLHFGPCVAGNGAAAGAHYNTDVLDGIVPPRTDQTTEVWLDITPGADGFATASATVPFVPSTAERSIVIHAMPTNPDNGAAGARQACLPVVIR